MPTQYWVCDFCGHQEESLSAAEKHEDRCDNNPDAYTGEEDETE